MTLSRHQALLALAMRLADAREQRMQLGAPEAAVVGHLSADEGGRSSPRNSGGAAEEPMVRRASSSRNPWYLIDVSCQTCVMASSGPGPRDYLAGTERALYAFARTTCYFPGCKTPVIVFVEGEPVSNAQIAHIRGANRGSARYDSAMTDDERRSYANLILLCEPHHEFVDRRHPDRYPPEMLAAWKAQREAEAGIDVPALAGLTDEGLVELIERAVASISPQRLLTVELGLGVAARGQTIVLPTETAKDYFERYAEQGPAVLVLTVRSVGGLKASVDSYDVRLAPTGDRLMGINDFPGINPPLPCPVDIGESQRWLYELRNITALIGALQKVHGQVSAVIGEASLGSGETIESAELPIEFLGPLPD